ncbi:MAG: arginine N-succinyltransferase [Candidatus Omnitrophota bacterium]|nr:arginine N-succinyltransferase [Candidatus Omnitrophota bacterium]
MFIVREAGPRDFQGVFALAKILDSYNLPADPAFIRELLRTSKKSFGGQLPKSKARYLFVLEKTRSTGYKVPGTLVGCSLIMAKHGTPGHPHLWFSLDRIVKRSKTLGIQKSHTVLRLGGTEDGPTEVGGLVVLPQYRHSRERCGLQLSYARFLYMAMHPERFEKSVLIEYRGAMGAKNKSPFWEAIGRVFTGLPYQRADRLSARNKEFIQSLLPSEPIYCALLPGRVQQAIGAIHPSARPAAAMAGRIGFRPTRQVEPFDGGPYYTAARRKIRLVREARELPVLIAGAADRKRTRPYLVAEETGGTFRAVLSEGAISAGRFKIEEQAFRKLKMKAGDPVYVCSVSR